MSRYAIFTICSGNYFHFARTLMDSIARSDTNGDLFVLLVDRNLDEDAFRGSSFTTVSLPELDLPHANKLCFKYTILELNTAVKPYFFERLFDRGFDRAIYLDPDIFVYRSLNPILERLDSHDAVVTPHISRPLNDGCKPDDLDILRSGTFNLGFLGLRASRSTRAFLGWWAEKLADGCVVDLDEGLFVDQKWCEFIPSFIETAYIERSPGYNVAYWNLPHRTVTKEAGEYRVNGDPLGFFHFSGVSPGNPLIFSKHEDRFAHAGLPSAVRELTEAYVDDVKSNDMDRYRAVPYGYGFFDGTEIPIPDAARRVYRSDSNVQRIFGDNPFDASRDPGFRRSYNRFVFGRGNPVTALCREIHARDKDLREAFPDIRGRHGITMAAWFKDLRPSEYGLHEGFIEPVRRKLHDLSESGSYQLSRFGSPGFIHALLFRTVRYFRVRGDPPTAPRPADGAEPRSRPGPASRLKDRIAAVGLSTARKILPLDVRRRLDMWTSHGVAAQYGRAYRGGASGRVVAPGSHIETGINVVGYVHAELGVGESARAMIRACAAEGLPVKAVEFSVGCRARISETIDESFFDGSPHGINVFHINADQAVFCFNHLGISLFEGRYNIGYWAWEAPEFPDRWDAAFPLYDEIWTPSTFVQRSVSMKSPLPVLTVPHAVAPSVDPRIDRSDLGLPDDGFIFLSLADFNSVPERKNPLGALDAFLRAFGSKPGRNFLALKLLNSDSNPEMMSRIYDRLHERSDVILITDPMDRAHVNALIYRCDCLVSLHRSEGFGLPMAEAMSLGKPVIATAWSGNMDFMTPHNSLLVDYELVTLDRGYGPYERGSTWAEPDIGHASQLMRSVTEDADGRARIGRRAAETMKSRFSAGAVGTMIRQRLERIRNRILV